MKEIDEVIGKHSGWPGAFQSSGRTDIGANSFSESNDNLMRESCDEVQGFYVGHPAQIDTYAEMIGRVTVSKLKVVSG